MIRLIAYSHPFNNETIECWVKPNQTIAAIAGTDSILAWVRDANNVDQPVPDWMVSRVTLKKDCTLIVRPVPRAFYTASAVFAAVGGGLLGAAAATATFIAVQAAIFFGSRFLSSLIAPDAPDRQASGPYKGLDKLTKTSNQVVADAPIPRIYGRWRFYPPIPVTGQPYTETYGEDQYLVMRLVLGWGPLAIGGQRVGKGHPKIDHNTKLDNEIGQPPIRIGDTGINKFNDVRFEIGRADQMTLYTDTVIENQVGWETELKNQDRLDDKDKDDDGDSFQDGQQITRTTARDVTAFSIDFSGRIWSQGHGGVSYGRIVYQIEWRKTGSNGSWQSDELRLQGKKEAAESRDTFKTNVPKGQYDVRITRLRTYLSSFEGGPSTKGTVTVLRSFKDQNPFDVDGVINMDLRIKAGGQLKNTVKKVNVLATSVLPVYDGNNWSEQATRKHPWIFADILTGTANRRPLTHDDLDVDALKDWADALYNHQTFDGVFSDKQNTLNRIKTITSAGRAAWSVRADNIVTIIRDNADQIPKAQVSPRNSWNYSYHLSGFNPPDAVKVKFTDEQHWQDQETIVYDDGKDRNNANIFQSIEGNGIVTHKQAYHHGRYYLANQRLRAIEKHTWHVEAHGLNYTVGDLVTLTNDVILVGLGFARVTQVYESSTGEGVYKLDLDSAILLGNGNLALQIQRVSDGSITTSKINEASSTPQSIVSKDYLEDVAADDHIVIGEAGKVTEHLRVTEIKSQGGLEFQITAEPYAPEVLDAIKGDIPAFNPQINQPVDPENYPPDNPIIQNIASGTEFLARASDGSVIAQAVITFRSDSQSGLLTQYIEAQYRRDQHGTGWHVGGQLNSAIGQIAIGPLDSDTKYNFRIRAVRANAVSDWVYQNHRVVGKSAPPSDVQNFTAKFAKYNVKLSWDAVADLDVKHYEIQEKIDGEYQTATLTDSTTQIIDVLPTQNQASKNYHFRIRAVDSASNPSADWNYTHAIVTTPSQAALDYVFEGINLVLRYSAQATQFPIKLYRIYKDGVLYDSITAEKYSVKVTWLNAIWAVSAVDVADNEGVKATVRVDIDPPTVQFNTSQVIDNNVLLYWTGTAGSLPIDHYDVAKDGQTVGQAQSTFKTLFLTRSGAYDFKITPIDSAGNGGTADTQTNTVDQPPDFLLNNEFEAWDFTNGSTTNAVAQYGHLVLPVYNKSWQDHFGSQNWATPEAQIDAGYPILIQPTPANADYTEVYDCGTVLKSSRITTTPTFNTLAGTPDHSVQISTKANESDSWTDFNEGSAQVYGTNFRYIKVHVSINTSNNKGLTELKRLYTKVDVKNKTDQGSVLINANPTTVSLNSVEFVDIESIVLSIKGQSARTRTAIYDFVDTPYPDHFDIYVYDNNGNAVTGDIVSYQIRGN